jgi:hypothetical protein
MNVAHDEKGVLCKTNVNKKNISQNYFQIFLGLLILFLYKIQRIRFVKKIMMPQVGLDTTSAEAKYFVFGNKSR